MAHVHTFGEVAPAAAGIIQYVLQCSFRHELTILKSWSHILLCDRVRKPMLFDKSCD